MSKNKEIGRKGESIAIDYLRKKGYSVIEHNYRYRRYEIDIIAMIDNVLVFIEVKSRSSLDFGHPDEAVDNLKIEHILRCAGHYIHHNQWDGDIRFDIISILFDREPVLEHIQDAFY